MASEGDKMISVFDKLSNEYLQCNICHDTYKQPKILNCLHSFCYECLLEYQTSQGPVKLKCPVCRQETVILEGGVTGLKTNFPLQGMVEEFQKQEKLLASGRCSPQTGERVGTPPPRRNVCLKHPGEKMWFYCRTCRELVCHMCTAKTHRDHDFVEIDKAANTCRETLGGFIPRISEIIACLEQALEVAKTDTQQINSETKLMRKTVEERARVMLASLMDAKQNILKEIDMTESLRVQLITQQTTKLSKVLHETQLLSSILDKFTTNDADEEILSLYEILHCRLQDIASRSFIFPKHRPSPFRLLPPEEELHVDLGRLTIEIDKWKMAMKVGKMGPSTEDFDGARGVCLCTDGEIAVADVGLWSRGITIFKSDWSIKTSLKFSDKPLNVASVDNFIIVVDSKKQVKVYDAKQQSTFDIWTTQLANDPQIPVNIVSVAASSDGILIGDVLRKVVTRHDSKTRQLLQTIPTTVPPFFIASKATGHLLVSGLDAGKLEEIDTVTGLARFTVTPALKGEHQVSCRGVCYSDDQSFFAVLHGKESNIGHVHQYDSMGQFLGCVVQDLYDPNEIAFTSCGELAIADCFSVKVYIKH